MLDDIGQNKMKIESHNNDKLLLIIGNIWDTTFTDIMLYRIDNNYYNNHPYKIKQKFRSSLHYTHHSQLHFIAFLRHPNKVLKAPSRFS